MIKFKTYLNESLEFDTILSKLYIEEEFIWESSDDAAKKKVGSNAKGVLHELLVGKHLNVGKHMEKHPDVNGDSPQQAHDKIKSKISKEDYDKINKRAEGSAKDIRHHVERTGHKIHSVHWTSKPGDIKRSTGVESSQKEDQADIMVNSVHPKSGHQKHTSVGLKVTDGSNKHVPASNPGIESTHGGKKHLDAHRKGILRDYPAMVGAKGKPINGEARRALLKTNPKMRDDIKSRNATTLNKIAKGLHDHLKSSTPEEVAHHIRTHVLQTHATPLQKLGQGHEAIRHTTYTKRGVEHHDSYDPSTHFGHILNHPEHIEVKHVGTSVNFHDKRTGKVFASHRIKFNSQSDPLSSVKGSGTAVGKD